MSAAANDPKATSQTDRDDLAGEAATAAIPAPKLAIATLRGIPAGGSAVVRDPREPIGSWAPGIMLLRQGERVFAYVNNCPHRGGPLDRAPGQVLNPALTHIQCASHGALFEIATGVCVFGPCHGDALRALPITVEDGKIWLAADAPRTRAPAEEG